jgi:hypothetical protein
VSAFVPAVAFCVDITKTQRAVATFSEDHTFSNGEYVSFRVTKPFGMVEINNQRGLVLDHDTLTITTDINSSNYTAFVYPAIETKVTPPTVVPAGSGIIPATNPSTVSLIDVFDDRPTSEQ